MQNDRLLTISAIAILIFVPYWFLIRPRQIKAECRKQAETTVQSNAPQVIDTMVDLVYIRNEGKFTEAAYQYCLKQKGL